MSGTTDAVPPELLGFLETLKAREGTALDLLASFDGYTNQSGPEGAEVHHGVLVRGVAGWRVTADIYRPLGEPPFPTVLWLHGGAWVLGAPASHRRLAADLADLGLLTVMLDYRRAPKHRFPAAVEDTVDALSWVREHAAEFGGDPGRLFVGGDSAGGNLAAAALAGGAVPPVAGALLCYGIYDVHRALPVLTDLVGGPDPDSQLYLEPADARALKDDPRLHPERYCTGFPPTLVLAGDRDPLYGESVSLAERLAAAGVPHRFATVPNAPHGLLQLPGHPANERGLREIREFVQRLR
ncbi:alpha/beta hydrolase [Amycolatopsis sp. Poz14]|uniref:alpha/beta hydrolase n=1 Tax=Amycolatopsis sp. Poz14 TaxID=1447705 RepID=UPI001EE7DAE1|nr:alpha/beta hydrolase [Amycolatopsis sp. Poz14]MCG3753949.1 alpha/beta hydrolase [Amycolatopsis sp. Poz14]